MPYKDPKNPKNIAYRKAYYEKKKSMWYERYGKKATYKWREKNPEQYSKIVEKYRTRNRNEILEKQKLSYQKHIDKRHAAHKKRSENLTDSYMRTHLRKAGYSWQDIRKHPELIETHRILLKIKRLCKTSNS